MIAAVNEFGGHVLVTGAIALWVVIVLRAPGTVRSVPQRRLLIAVAGLAGSITVYLDPVTALLSRTPLAGSCGILMNVWGVLSAAFILDFVMAAVSNRRPVPVYGSAVAVSVALVLLDNADGGGQAGCVTSIDVPWYSPFWWLLCVAHIVAVVPPAVLCARYARRASTRPVRIGLAILAAGFVSSTIFWSVVVLGHLLTKSSWLGALFPLNIGLTAWLMAAGTGLPLVMQVPRRWRNLRILWRLRPLWRRLAGVVPRVRLPEPTGGGSIGRSVELRLYRRVIEIRDALLILRRHVDRKTVDAARAHVRAAAPEGDEDALVTACWLAVAQAVEERGDAPDPAVPPTPEPRTTGDAWTNEITFQEALARVHQAPLVHDFARRRPDAQRPADASGGVGHQR